MFELTESQSEKFRGYFNNLERRIATEKLALEELEAAVETKRKFIRNPFADGLRDELIADLLIELPEMSPGVALRPEDMALYSACLIRLAAAHSIPVQSLQPTHWQALWSAIDTTEPAEIAAFSAYASQSRLFVVGSRPNINPAGVPLYAAYLLAAGLPDTPLVQADELLSQFDVITTSYNRR
ncbi:MAG: hypothetical protein DRQ62_06260 [Gammaproteobacteria bacterium]|nr:MAG: hypothetical protein DRQ62_06260 [Gammaproteobacteria bacterium]